MVSVGYERIDLHGPYLYIGHPTQSIDVYFPFCRCRNFLFVPPEFSIHRQPLPARPCFIFKKLVLCRRFILTYLKERI